MATYGQWLAACALWVSLVGCGGGGDVPVAGEKTASDEVVATQAKDAAPATPDSRRPAADAAREEFWDVCTINGAKVGYVHTVLRPVEENGRKYVRIDQEQSLVFRRFNQTTAQELALTSVESPAGELVRFESRLSAGSQLTISRGHVEDGKLHVETTTPGKTANSQIALPRDCRAFFTAELQLREKPLKPGEKRSYDVLLPALNQPALTKLEGLVYEAIDVGGQSRRLLKVRKSDKIGETTIDSTLWVDEHGDALVSKLSGALPIMTRRATRDEALEASDDRGFDLGAASVVKIARPIPDPHATRKIVYRAKLPGEDLAKSFESGPSQTVKVTGAGEGTIEVRAVRGDSAASGEAGTQPTKADRVSNNLIQSDAKIIRDLARQVAPEEKDPWKLAVALEAFVRRTVKTKNFSQAFATAAEVAETRTGDCTEHAVLLAALCRARDIPARVAIGLVYASELGGFAYHMWNEVWIGDRWVPLDATLGRGGIGGGHLKLLTSNLEGSDAYGAFLPVFRVLGRLELEVVSVE